jgi:hypothetical protein
MLRPSSSLLAQETQSGPTDSDLKAGYCLSIFQDREARLHPWENTSQNKELEEYWKKTCHEDQDKIARLNGYLEARGYVYGEKDPIPVVVAEDRGHTDSKDCLQFVAGHRSDLDACRKNCETQKMLSRASKRVRCRNPANGFGVARIWASSRFVCSQLVGGLSPAQLRATISTVLSESIADPLELRG